MSRPRNEPPRKVVIDTPDGALPSRPMVLTGIIRTDVKRQDGKPSFALAVAELTADGEVKFVKLGRSQTEKRYVAIEHVRSLMKASEAA